MKLLLLLIPALLLSNSYVRGTLGVTALGYLDRPTEKSFHVNVEDITPVLTMDSRYIDNNIEAKLRLSNKLDDTFIEHASVAYAGRNCNHIYKLELGTIDTFQGVFSETKLANEQNPFIFKNHGVYNNEFLAGYLDTTVGIQGTYTYLLNYKYLLTAKYSYTQARELSANRSEGSIYGYNSKYQNFDYTTPIQSVDLLLAYKNSFTVFANKAHITINSVGTAEVPSDIYSKYMSEFDSSIFVPSTPFSININRVGATYTNPYITYGYETFFMDVVNTDIDLEFTARGEMHYLAMYFTDALTGYVSYGVSTNDKKGSKPYEDKIVGARYTISQAMAILAEWKRSSWIQHKTYTEHSNYLDQDSRAIELISTKFIISF